MRAMIGMLSLLFIVPLAAAVEVPLTTPVSGVVKTVLVTAGQSVKKGQLLLSLDDTIYQARVIEAEAGVSRLQAEAGEANKDLKRAQELYDRAVSSTTEYDQAKLRHARADGLYQEARARLTIAKKNLEYTSLRAPFNATVSKRLAEPGMVVSPELQPQALIVLSK